MQCSNGLTPGDHSVKWILLFFRWPTIGVTLGVVQRRQNFVKKKNKLNFARLSRFLCSGNFRSMVAFLRMQRKSQEMLAYEWWAFASAADRCFALAFFEMMHMHEARPWFYLLFIYDLCSRVDVVSFNAVPRLTSCVLFVVLSHDDLCTFTSRETISLQIVFVAKTMSLNFAENICSYRLQTQQPQSWMQTNEVILKSIGRKEIWHARA